MIDLSRIIDESRVLLDAHADCSKALFREVSERLSELTGIASREIANALNERERMGTTAVGGGVSIPHARMESVSSPQAMVVRLEKAIDMDAVDDKLVDVFVVLLVPSEADNDHLRVLSRISRIIRQPDNLLQIRRASRPSEIAAIFAQE